MHAGVKSAENEGSRFEVRLPAAGGFSHLD